jgi:N-acetylmuramoyl-L-alanine amidase
MLKYLMLCGLVFAPWAQALQLSAVRLWPSPDYTRITLEAAEPVVYRYFLLNNPDRLVVDLEGVEADAELNTLPARVNATDPYIASIRTGINRPGVMRLVLQLKAPVKPSIFQLKPLGQYGHRLVLDLYPAQTPDALARLAQGKPLASDTPEKAAPGKAGQEPNAAPPKPQQYMRLITVAIDAGHGGEDPGAKGATGTNEKDVTLAVARRLKDKLDTQDNLRGVLVRDGDYFIPLAGRVQKARGFKADLFVSIHADAFVKSHARGSSVFALSENGATSAAARWLAKKENEADLIGGVNIDVKDLFLKRTLIDLSQTATINDSLILGRAVLSEIGEINTLHKAQVEQAGFAVLKAPDIPSILVETAFISNPEEEKRLNDDAYQDQLAEAIVAGIKAYFAKHPPSSRTRLVQDY